MTLRLQVGDEAPDFDLASTEDAMIMLRDETPRSAVVLYFFGDPASERTKADLLALAREQPALTAASIAVFGISPAKLAALKAIQADLKLRFPLLSDDRGLASAYGVAAPNEGEEAAPALVVVDRGRKVLWLANPVPSVEGALPEVRQRLGGLPRSTVNYPRKATNFLVDWWVGRRASAARRRA